LGKKEAMGVLGRRNETDLRKVRDGASRRRVIRVYPRVSYRETNEGEMIEAQVDEITSTIGAEISSNLTEQKE
jgi:hypothetical protein